MKKIKKILIPTDFSPLSVVAVEYVKTFSKAFDAEVHVLHVVDPNQIIGIPHLDLRYARVSKDIMDDAMTELKNFSSKHLRGVEKVKCSVRQGTPHEELIQFVRQNKFDLIVMATHGRTGLAHVLIGSVAERVVRHSPVPVLLIKPEEMKS